ncbi:hypothetical protein D3C87_2127790 [compost metagenome]
MGRGLVARDEHNHQFVTQLLIRHACPAVILRGQQYGQQISGAFPGVFLTLLKDGIHGLVQIVQCRFIGAVLGR